MKQVVLQTPAEHLPIPNLFALGLFLEAENIQIKGQKRAGFFAAFHCLPVALQILSSLVL